MRRIFQFNGEELSLWMVIFFSMAGTSTVVLFATLGKTKPYSIDLSLNLPLCGTTFFGSSSTATFILPFIFVNIY